MTFNYFTVIIAFFLGFMQAHILIEPVGIQIANPNDPSIANPNRHVTFKISIDPNYIDEFDLIHNYGTLQLLYFTRKGKQLTSKAWEIKNEFYQSFVKKQEPIIVNIDGAPKFKFDEKPFYLQMQWKSSITKASRVFHKYAFNFLDLATRFGSQQLQIILDHENKKVIQNPFTVHELNQIVDGIQKFIRSQKREDIKLPKKLPESTFFTRKENFQSKLYHFLAQLQSTIIAKPNTNHETRPYSKCIALDKIRKKMRTKQIYLTFAGIGFTGLVAAGFTAIVAALSALPLVNIFVGVCFVRKMSEDDNFMTTPIMKQIDQMRTEKENLLEEINSEVQPRIRF